MTRHEASVSDTVQPQSAAPPGEMLSKTLANFDALFPLRRRSLAIDAEAQQRRPGTPGAVNHPGPPASPARPPLFGR